MGAVSGGMNMVSPLLVLVYLAFVGLGVALTIALIRLCNRGTEYVQLLIDEKRNRSSL